jgi:hypothetical protein
MVTSVTYPGRFESEKKFPHNQKENLVLIILVQYTSNSHQIKLKNNDFWTIFSVFVKISYTEHFFDFDPPYDSD